MVGYFLATNESHVDIAYIPDSNEAVILRNDVGSGAFYFFSTFKIVNNIDADPLKNAKNFVLNLYAAGAPNQCIRMFE